ncbi:Hydroxysteroid dehydrogenase-like protein 2 [Sorochytrium milnesiophthora]
MSATGTLRNKVVFISGASRGIGQAIAMRCARDGAKIVVAAKTAEPHPKLPGTIYTAAKDIEKAGGEALPLICDIRSEGTHPPPAEQVQDAIDKTVAKWGRIDVVVNNASAISLTNTEETSVKKFDLMHSINLRGSWLVTKCALPHLKKSKGKVLNISPPLFMSQKWFAGHSAYTLAKYGMSVWVLGMSEEFKEHGVAINALWPRTVIDTAALQAIGLGNTEGPSAFRRPEIMADAAYALLLQPNTYTGKFAIDEDIIRMTGMSDKEMRDRYNVSPEVPTDQLDEDFFLEKGYKFELPPHKAKL